ncbi:MAG: DUF4258 domain-containing protein [Alphaproteobacteria bacterium]|nr:DUF4258 domain-containing protein [Alphaproteobacteria bacterium]
MAKLIQFQKDPSPHDLMRLIREIAQDTGNVILTDHAKEQMKERNITFPHILGCLRQGQVTEGPYQSVKGDWTCNLTRAVAGIDITAVVAVDLKCKAIIVTVKNWR